MDSPANQSQSSTFNTHTHPESRSRTDIYCTRNTLDATIVLPKSFVIAPEFNDLAINLATNSVGACTINQVNYRLYPTFKITVKDFEQCGVKATKRKDELGHPIETLLLLHLRFPVIKSLRTNEDTYATVVCSPQCDSPLDDFKRLDAAPEDEPSDISFGQKNGHKDYFPNEVKKSLLQGGSNLSMRFEERNGASLAKSIDVLNSSSLDVNATKRSGQMDGQLSIATMLSEESKKIQEVVAPSPTNAKKCMLQNTTALGGGSSACEDQHKLSIGVCDNTTAETSRSEPSNRTEPPAAATNCTTLTLDTEYDKSVHPIATRRLNLTLNRSNDRVDVINATISEGDEKRKEGLVQMKHLSSNEARTKELKNDVSRLLTDGKFLADESGETKGQRGALQDNRADDKLKRPRIGNPQPPSSSSSSSSSTASGNYLSQRGRPHAWVASGSHLAATSSMLSMADKVTATDDERGEDRLGHFNQRLQQYHTSNERAYENNPMSASPQIGRHVTESSLSSASSSLRIRHSSLVMGERDEWTSASGKTGPRGSPRTAVRPAAHIGAHRLEVSKTITGNVQGGTNDDKTLATAQSLNTPRPDLGDGRRLPTIGEININSNQRKQESRAKPATPPSDESNGNDDNSVSKVVIERNDSAPKQQLESLDNRGASDEEASSSNWRLRQSPTQRTQNEDSNFSLFLLSFLCSMLMILLIFAVILEHNLSNSSLAQDL
jgi:hypothetical protein